MKIRRRWLRSLSVPLIVGCLIASPVTSSSVRAQAPGEAAQGEDDESKGRPLDGYLLMVMLATMALFVVGKTARR